ncbi:uncharacterized protein LOC142640019 [Castanea sativa]|uniref:uncharacterized protein LOC142640019 n=1 Tax=Castanea sativa TaxID=21020 RepID=UPI003F650FC2
MAIRTFKVGLPTKHGLRKSLTGKPVSNMRQLMDRIDKYKRVEEDQQLGKGKAKVVPQDRRDFKSKKIMDKYLIKKPHTQDSSPVQDSSPSSKRSRVDFNLENLPSDPGLRQKISSYHPNNHDEIRRYYLGKGPCRPPHDYPVSYFSGKPRRFRVEWYENRNWLEYSIAKDAAFCFYCYLFGKDVGKQGGGDTFVTKGFRLWNQVGKLDSHVGGVNSAHNQAVKKSEDLQKEKQHIQSVLVKQSNQDKANYRIQLNAIVDCVRFLLFRGLAFHGHDESQGSSDKGNFLELLQFLRDHNESINEVMQNTWKNCKLTHHDIQKDMVNAIARETSKAIIEDLGNGFFSILVDESRDISVKEQMALVLRYVNKQGIIIERFLGIVHVASTTALSLKCAIEGLLCEHNLSLSRLRGQGYDGASNMQGDINGLKTLILKENKSAFYVHCFAHQLQLTLVAVAKNHINIADFFYVVSNLVTVVGGSCKRRDALRDAQFAKIKEDLENGVRRSGQGLNQETNLKRPGDTRWGSYYGTILNLILIFSAVADVLEIIEEDGLSDQKQRLQVMRDDEWTSLLTEVSSFCATHEIPILNMDEIFVVSGRPRRNTQQNTNLHHYRVELFYTVIDMQLQELNNRFSEVNTDLLICMACLNPSNSFVAFDKEKLIRLAKFYPYDFPGTDILALDSQLQNFIFDMRNDDLFLELQGVSELAEKLVSTRKHETYPLVYLLVKLALTLPVATATVERRLGSQRDASSKPPLGTISVILAAPRRTGSHPSKPHDDALVVTLRIRGYDMKRVLVDQDLLLKGRLCGTIDGRMLHHSLGSVKSLVICRVLKVMPKDVTTALPLMKIVELKYISFYVS